MDEQRIEELLSVYRYRQPMPALPARATPRRWWFAAAAAIAAVIVLAIVWPRHPRGWQVTQGGRRSILRRGETIAAGPGGARLESRSVGTVDVAAGSVVRFEGGNHLALDRGQIHARTISPPGIFVVDTPRARAIDLGCEYVLAVSANGGALLRVSAGWVQLQRDWQQTLVPQGARAIIAADGRVGPPVFDDAPPAFQKAVLTGNLGVVLALARRRDALTLLNLFRDASTDERLRIYDRLNQLVPAPASIPREAMKNWTIGTTDTWWPSVLRASGLRGIQKKGMRFPDA